MRPTTRLGLDYCPLEERLTPANAGDLDPNFGANGIALVPFPPGTSVFSVTATARAAVAQPDGRVVLAGSAPSTNGNDFAVARLLTDGNADPSFGFGGEVVLPFDLGGTNDDDGYGVALQTDGKIVVVGVVNTAGNGTDFGIVRLNPDGTPDATFGNKGFVDLPFSTSGSTSFNDDGAYGVAVQPDGRIVVVGYSRFDFAVARLKANGALDTTFGTKGQTTVPFSGSSFSTNKATSVALQPDGKIVLGGYAFGTSFNDDFAAARLTSTGAVDTTFGNKGTVTIPFDVGGQKTDQANAVAIQPDGKIILAGQIDTGFAFFFSGPGFTSSKGNDWAAVRLNPDGTLDNTFANGGKYTVGFNLGGSENDEATGVVVQANGDIVLTGSAEINGSFSQDFVAQRLTADGVVDTTFGTNGSSMIVFNSNSFFGDAPGANTSIITPDGNIVLAGTDGASFAAVRLFGTAPPPPPPPPVIPEPPPVIRPQPIPLSALPPAPAPVLTGGRPDGTAKVMLNGSAGGAFSAGSVITFFPLPTDVRTAVADVNGDLVPDFIGATGPGFGNEVVAFDGKTGQKIIDIVPFPNFTGGLFVAAADLNGDGMADLVITPDKGGGPIVAVYDGGQLSGGVSQDLATIGRFLGIGDPAFRGGARAAVGDVNHDGTPDIVVAAGFGGGPRVAIFDGKSVASGSGAPNRLVPDFFVFEPALRNGAFVSVGDVNGDGFADLAFGGGPTGGPRVRLADGQKLLAGAFTNFDQLPNAQMQNFFAGDPSTRGGVSVALRDVDGDGKADLVAGSGAGLAPNIKVYRAADLLKNSLKTSQDLNPFDDTTPLPNGVFVG